MLKQGDSALPFLLPRLAGGNLEMMPGQPMLLVFFETDCPTCHLTIPYINRLAERMGDQIGIIGISQDGEYQTRGLVENLRISFPIALDQGLRVSRQYDPQAVPTLFLIDRDGKI